jgi:hypothetical protein
MKSRPTQLGVRENTASSRQHAPRLAMNASVLQSDMLSATELRPDESTREPVHPIRETFELSLKESGPGEQATGGGESRAITSGRLGGDGKRPTVETSFDMRRSSGLREGSPEDRQAHGACGQGAGAFPFWTLVFLCE